VGDGTSSTRSLVTKYKPQWLKDAQMISRTPTPKCADSRSDPRSWSWEGPQQLCPK
jgi:hypothetical protein